ncbi:MAG: PIN domain-containing protein [Acidimicrobiia bacterium]|nr:PIN domain-containing protein [Acidimicrobiia bacterium]MDX2467409.1 PIN domain-containing protein [Acidimicrobiia bacterium]
MIIADTSGLLAAMDPDERHHEACRAVVENHMEPLVVSPFVLAELDYLVHGKLGVDAELAMLDDMAAGAYQLAEMQSGDVAACRSIISMYRDLDLGLADASNMILATRHRTADIFTLDERHFRAVRTSNRKPFRLLPADGAAALD